MNILFIKHFFIGCMVYDIPIVSVFGHCTFGYFPICYYKIKTYILLVYIYYIK